MNSEANSQEARVTPDDQMVRSDLNIGDRRSRILQMVNQDGIVRVVDLSEYFGISEVTIRNDLTELERQDLLERIHGGAVRTNRSYYRLTVQERLSAHKNEKISIASHIRGMVNPGDTIFLNSGTTTVYVARAIKDIPNVLVLTNSPLAAQELSFANQCEVVLVGGSYNGPMAFTYGDDAVKQIAQYHANKFFLACDGVSASAGIMTYNTHEVDINRKFMDNSATIICVADLTKIGRLSRVRIGPVDCLDTLVTNDHADTTELEAIRSLGVSVVTIP